MKSSSFEIHTTITKVCSKVGYRLAKGEKLDDILGTIDGVSEGVYTVLALDQLIRSKVRNNVYDFKFPILSGVAKIIQGSFSPSHGLELLMKYPLYAENIQMTF